MFKILYMVLALEKEKITAIVLATRWNQLTGLQVILSMEIIFNLVKVQKVTTI